MKAGITGHQNLGDDEAVAWIRRALDRLIIRQSVSRAFTCLAMGADQLFAELIVEKRIPFTAIIPCVNYDSAFQNQEARTAYLRFVEMADNVMRLDFSRPSKEAFFEGGRRVVQLCQVLFAVWNGKPAKGFGGTADIVAYANEAKVRTFHLNPENQKVLVL